MPLQNCVQWNEHCPHRSGILSATFDHYRWLLQPALNLHVYLPFLRTGAIVNGYMPLSKWIPWPSFGVTFGNFRPLYLYHYLERGLSPNCEQFNVNENPRNPSGYFRYSNFRPLSLTTSTCVSVHRDLYHYLERALSRTCEHYNVNEHPRNPSGYFR